MDTVDLRASKIAAAEARQVPGGRAVLNALLRAHMLPMPTFHYEIRGPDGRLVARLDGAWVAQRVALEGDSIWHASGHAQANDRARDAFLASMAWEVIRLRRGDLHGPRGQHKAEEIRQALGI